MQINTELDKLLARQKDLTDSGQKNTKAYQDIFAQVRVDKDAIKENTNPLYWRKSCAAASAVADLCLDMCII